MNKVVFILLFYSIKILSQGDAVYYKAKIISAVFFDENNNLVSSVPLGKNVELINDTFFKMWAFRYSDQEGNKQAFKFSYLQTDSYGNLRMRDTYNNVFIIDEQNLNKTHTLLICSEVKLKNGLDYCMEIKQISKDK